MSPSSGDDYYFLETEDPKVAAAFGMAAMPSEEEAMGDNGDDAFRRTMDQWD